MSAGGDVEAAEKAEKQRLGYEVGVYVLYGFVRFVVNLHC
jgi:hypothetical protein